MSVLDNLGGLFIGLVVVVILFLGLKTVNQAQIAVVTMFGKYRRILKPGLNLIIPFFEVIHQRISVQNQTIQLQFSAITSDQAAVHFTSTIIFAVTDQNEETIKLVAFKFIDQSNFETALTSAVESSVRSFVATKKQAELLGLRQEIVEHSKENLDEQLASWGYQVSDLQITDLKFDEEVMISMTRVVAAKNAQVAAEFEGQALLIAKTKEAEAHGAAIRIAAENEAEAARLRGAGLASFRKEITQGLTESAKELQAGGLDASILTFSMWTETLRDAAREGQGNVIFLDGNIATGEDASRRLQAMLNLKEPKK